MDEEFKRQLIDRFEGFELVDYLNIDVEDIVDAFEEQIVEAQEDLEEFLSVGR